ncbi:FHA domain-containing protein [Azospirillum lipoferum]|uniref:FHA domain-containing protein n=1 Tax=Azospirillum lipoferum TaxID=193 RepID=UPI001FCB0D02|nr:FHA domain-containing protein [Azospirillum lipoferum]
MGNKAAGGATGFFNPNRSDPPSGDGPAVSPARQTAPDEPVVGWLVIVEGPGRGTSRPLGYGMNSIGRAEGQRVRLDLGDNEISRQQHAQLTYDPRGRKFYLRHGEGANLTYVGDQPVLTPVELHGGEFIGLGSKTVLRFVPFCGPDFDWQDR